MTKKMVLSFLLSMAIILVITVSQIISVTSDILVKRQETLLREVVDIVSNGYQIEGEDFIHKLKDSDYRMMIFSPSGKILNETMNDLWYLVTDHRDVDIFLDRVSKEDDIVSSTTQYLGGGSLILAGRMLEDGTTIVATTVLNTYYDTIFEMRYQLLCIILFIIILSVIFAKTISYLVIKPLNKIDVENAEPNSIYKEVRPFLIKIKEQKENLINQERELKQGQTEFSSITESLKEGLFLVNRESRISFMNKSAKKLFGLIDPINAVYSDCLPKDVCQVIENTDDDQRNSLILVINNSTYKLETTPLCANGLRTGTSVLIYDITEQLNQENHRREFTANVSHELKTPLHSILGSAELLKNNLVKDCDKMKFITQIHSECLRMRALIDDLLYLSKMDEDNISLSKTIVKTRDVAESVKKNLEGRTKEENREINVSGTNSTIICNSSLLYSALYNLVDNAIKYSKKDIEIILAEDEKTAYIKVKDKGIGIPSEYQDRIFERFFRIDKSRSREVGGTGLGLAIVKHSCIINGGDISFISNKDTGTVFTIAFPKATEN